MVSHGDSTHEQSKDGNKKKTTLMKIMWSKFQRSSFNNRFIRKRSLIKNLFWDHFGWPSDERAFTVMPYLRDNFSLFSLFIWELVGCLLFFLLFFKLVRIMFFDHVFDCLNTISLSHSCLIKETTMLNANEMRKKPITKSNNIICDVKSKSTTWICTDKCICMIKGRTSEPKS